MVRSWCARSLGSDHFLASYVNIYLSFSPLFFFFLFFSLFLCVSCTASLFVAPYLSFSCFVGVVFVSFVVVCFCTFTFTWSGINLRAMEQLLVVLFGTGAVFPALYIAARHTHTFCTDQQTTSTQGLFVFVFVYMFVSYICCVFIIIGLYWYYIFCCCVSLRYIYTSCSYM